MVSQSGLRFHSKSEAINNEILKPFESLIRPLVERGELNQIVLSDAEIAVSALSGSFYVFIPNIKGSDYYVVDPVPKTLLGMASEMNISETGNTFYLSSSEQIQIRQTTGFLPDKIIERSLEPYLANFLPSLTKKIEFFSKTYREGELAVITDAVNFVLTNNLDARDESVRSAFIKALQKQGYGQTKVYTKVLDELAAIQDRWRETEAI